MNASQKNHCPCGPSCASDPCLCNQDGRGEETQGADGPACFCGTGCQCEA